MSNSSFNNDRRRFLTATTAVVGGVGVAAVTVPFIRSLNPSEKVKAVGQPVEVDISKLEEGQMMRVAWRGKPVWIIRRSPSVVAELSSHHTRLKDPDSIQAQQPDYVRNVYRSLKPEYFIAVGVCTHLGCSPNYRQDALGTQKSDRNTGFLCPCHRAVYDMAGRVLIGGPAPYNLVIPRHMYLNEHKILIGIDENGEA
ncbi:ubiquinol-cytochrome c reductase iron-sulfur subunit [Vibrio mangrovi]|uniref:Ubiquinol-cytochrome c reductase iron-sulfur subunit n=1 Tax=Vibrio mangrovi TaxID=474394 RepID=A0A1Y6IRE1_9VIBR|nr:ubiquinol-cytochrome c reductase iron-sulfur subunit [Vibrio mangrovi]MDW6001757.1 ubiquinol-cytochrome c reductase iron-sulfur subunit [Vibrio mangrovi]SMS00217.1 Ubiquinol-cytochrome c reductase iron-sulfur subunit [Vibrio mangrovi]